MRSRPIAAAAALAAIGLLITTAPPAIAAPVQGVSGRVTDTSGNALGGRTVVLYSDGTADESEAAALTGNGIPLDVLGTAVTRADGSFSISPAAAGLAKAVARKDNALLNAGHADARGRTPLPVQILVDGGAGQYAGELTTTGKWTGSEPTITVIGGAATAPTTDAVVALADGSGACPTYFPYRSFYKLNNTTSFIDSPVVVGRSDTGARSTTSMYYAQSDTTTTEQFGGSTSTTVLVTAGQRRIAANTTSTTFSTPANSGKAYRITTRYRPYDLMCSNDSTGVVWVTPSYQWRPTVWTTGTSYASFTHTWTCQSGNRATISTPVNIGQSTSLSQNWSVGVSINGYGGTTALTRTSSTEAYQTWRVATGYSSANLCGKTDVPAYSLEIAEV